MSTSNPLEEKFVGKYLGPDKIVGVELLTIKTPSGGNIFEFETERVGQDNVRYTEKEIVPEKSVAIAVGDQPKDYTKLFQDKMNVIIPEIVNVIEEYNLDFSQVDALTRSLTISLDLRFNRALSFLFTGDDKNFIPGFDPRNSVSVLGTEKVIAAIPNSDAEGA